MDQVMQGGEKGVKGLITRRPRGCLWCYLVERQSSRQDYVESRELADGLGEVVWLLQPYRRGITCWSPDRVKPRFYFILFVFKPAIIILPLFGCYKEDFCIALCPVLKWFGVAVRQRGITHLKEQQFSIPALSYCQHPDVRLGSTKSTQGLVWHRDKLWKGVSFADGLNQSFTRRGVLCPEGLLSGSQ